jgi:hypothetical protein
MTSVGTGSLVYAAAGLLAHRPATTHWASLDLLAELDATVDVRRDEWLVDDGDVVACAGISAGIDVALHLVVRLAGADPARETRRGIQSAPHRRSDPPQLKGTRMQTASEDFSDVPTALGVPYAYWGLMASTTTSTARSSRPDESPRTSPSITRPPSPRCCNPRSTPELTSSQRQWNRAFRSATHCSTRRHRRRRQNPARFGEETMKDVAG